MNKAMSKINVPKKDWHRAHIKAALEIKGWTLRKLSKAHGYAPSTLKMALYQPYPKAESIIAKAIGVQPWEIWPSRYDKNGRPNRPIGRPTRKMIEELARKSNGKKTA